VDARVHDRSVPPASLTPLTHLHIHPQTSEVASLFCVCLFFALRSRYPTHPVDVIILKIIEATNPPVLPFSPVSCYNGCLFNRVTEQAALSLIQAASAGTYLDSYGARGLKTATL
jgi:hypothetical protein